MSHVLIVTGNRYSIKEVAKTVGFVLEQNGYQVTIVSNVSYINPRREKIDRYIVIYPYYPLFNQPHIWMAYHFSVQAGIPGLYYAMTEGVPKAQLLNPCHRRYDGVFTVSVYAKYLISRVGIPVQGVIPHGFPDFLEVTVIELSAKYRQKIVRDFGDKIILGAIADKLPRKNADGLIEALKLLASRRNDYVVLVETDPDLAPKFDNIPNTYIIGATGEQTHQEVLGFLGSVDAYIAPSFAEAFGLTVLEANYLGTPVVAPSLPPYKEFASDSNYFFEPEAVVEEDTREGVLMYLHKYSAKTLADQIEYAIDEIKNNRDSYQNRKIKVKEKVEPFKASVIYREFIKIIK